MPEEAAFANGRSGAPADTHVGSEIVALRAQCRRQLHVINALGEAVGTLKRGAKALTDENAELRADNDRLHGSHVLTSRAADRSNRGELAEAAIPLGVQAPGAARDAVALCLGDHVAPAVLEIALLLVSELVSNSVRHSGVPEGTDLTVRVHVWGDRCRLEVEDPGRDGIIAPHPPDVAKGAGMGLNLVQMLSERWGVVRAADGPTRVWAQLPRNAALA